MPDKKNIPTNIKIEQGKNCRNNKRSNGTRVSRPSKSKKRFKKHGKLKKRAIALAVVAALGVFGANQKLEHSKTQQLLDKKGNVYGFMTAYGSNDKASEAIVKQLEKITNNSVLDGYITASFALNSEGKLTNVQGKTPPEKTVQIVKENNKKALALVNNFDIVGWNDAKKITDKLFDDAKLQDKFIKDLITTCDKNRYDGVCVDFENVNAGKATQLNNLMMDMRKQFRNEGLFLTVCVPLKYHDNMNKAYDYTVLSEVCDGMIIMNYDETNYGAKRPGPVSSAPTTQKVINYVTSKVGVDNKNKVLIGIATYGRIWSNKEKGNAAGIDNIEDLIKKYKLPVLWDEKNKVPYLKYKDSRKGYGIRTVYFENEKSVNEKIQIVENSGLGGIALWRLGLESQKFLKPIGEQYAETAEQRKLAERSEHESLSMISVITKSIADFSKKYGIEISITKE